MGLCFIRVVCARSPSHGLLSAGLEIAGDPAMRQEIAVRSGRREFLTRHYARNGKPRPREGSRLD